MYCNILVTKPFDQVFTYKLSSNQECRVGNIASVPFGKKEDQIGMITEIFEDLPVKDNTYSIKTVGSVFDNIILNKNIIKFIKWISDYTLAPLGLVLKLFLINYKIVSHDYLKEKDDLFLPIPVQLNNEQQKAFEIIDKSLFKKSLPIVLEGVTGSGKTEVYFEAIEKVLKQSKQVLIMLPEISLTPQFEKRFNSRFGFPPLVWHSKISDKKRKNIWHRCYEGDTSIVVGARSSLFLPFNNLGLIVVDEEHDSSYKQEDNIRYQARDLAIVRSQIEKFPIILSSATPSLETQNNINKKKYRHVYLSSQFSGLELPKIELVNLQNNKLEKNKWISKQIFNELKNCIEKNGQALLFLNRRGYSPLSLCVDCGYRYQCDNCTAWLVMHSKKNRLLCHHCGSIYPIQYTCPKCHAEESVKLIGPGVERLAEELKLLFPKRTIGIMSSDNANTPKKINTIIDNFSKKNIDILVATQIMAKGYHFPNLSFVGVIDADSGLIGGDIRAIERTYNLLQQVSGRAGRSHKAGKVLIQTYFPKQPVIQSLQKRDRKTFVDQSLREREEYNIPPFGYLTAIIISGSSKLKVKSYASNLARVGDKEYNTRILGPVEAPLFLLRGKYRYRLLLKGNNRKILNKFTKNIMKALPPPPSIRLIIDVDPYSFV